MFANWAPENHENWPERGRGGSVWAQTLPKRRPEAQDHFPSPPGPQKQINKFKKGDNVENPDSSRSKSSIISAGPLGTGWEAQSCSLLSFVSLLYCYVLSFSIVIVFLYLQSVCWLLQPPQTQQTTINLPDPYFSGMPANHSKYCIYAISAPYTTPWGIKWLQTEPRGLQHHQKASQNDPSEPPWHRFLHALAKTCACQGNTNIYYVLATLCRARARLSETILATICYQTHV